MSKTQKVATYLDDVGHITSMEAIEKFKATRLAAIIFVLRKRGWPITTERVEYINEDGERAHYGRYWLERNKG
jgi:hypothetical protein